MEHKDLLQLNLKPVIFKNSQVFKKMPSYFSKPPKEIGFFNFWVWLFLQKQLFLKTPIRLSSTDTLAVELTPSRSYYWKKLSYFQKLLVVSFENIYFQN